MYNTFHGTNEIDDLDDIDGQSDEIDGQIDKIVDLDEIVDLDQIDETYR